MLMLEALSFQGLFLPPKGESWTKLLMLGADVSSGNMEVERSIVIFLCHCDVI